jgi:hypothetical protein
MSTRASTPEHSREETMNEHTKRLFDLLKAGSETSPSYSETKALLDKGAEVTIEDDNDDTLNTLAQKKKNKGAMKAISEAATRHFASTPESAGHNVLEGESLQLAKKALSKMGGKTRRSKRKLRKTRRHHKKSHHRRR